MLVRGYSLCKLSKISWNDICFPTSVITNFTVSGYERISRSNRVKANMIILTEHDTDKGEYDQLGDDQESKVSLHSHTI